MPEIAQYALTCTIQPFVRQLLAKEQYTLLHEYVVRELKKFCDQLTLVVELTKSYDLHFHGVITFPIGIWNPGLYLRDALRKDPLIGFITLPLITDPLGWLTYISKSLLEVKTSIGEPPVLIDDHDWFLPYRHVVGFCQDIDLSAVPVAVPLPKRRGRPRKLVTPVDKREGYREVKPMEVIELDDEYP